MLLILSLLCPLSSGLASNVEDSLVVGIQSTRTTSIQPLFPQERDMLSVYDLVWESLVTIDDNYIPQPCLARSWEVSPNGRTWTFRLRTDVSFSNGQPLRAADVVATAQAILARARDETTTDKGFYYNLKYFISDISASSDDTVVVRADRPYYGLLYAMTFPVLPESQVNMASPCGTGPYVITDFSPANMLSLSASSTWWKNTPQVRHITFVMTDTPKKVIENYEYARVDTVFTRSIAAAQYRSGTSSLALNSRTPQLELLLMNHSSSRLADVRVRKAIRYVLDLDRIASSVYMGMVDRTNLPVIPGTWMYNDNLDAQFRPNLEEARRLLEEAGWGDSNQDGYLDRLDDEDPTRLVELRLNLYVYEEPDNDVRIECANMIREQLAQVGITVNISTMTFTGIQEKLNAASFNLALVSFSMDTAPDPGFLLMNANTGNYGRYRSTAMTDLFKELRKCVSQQEYQQKLYEIESLFVDDCPFICLYWREGVVLTRKMYTTVRDVREHHLLKGIESFRP